MNMYGQAIPSNSATKRKIKLVLVSCSQKNLHQGCSQMMIFHETMGTVGSQLKSVVIIIQSSLIFLLLYGSKMLALVVARW